MDQSEEAAKDRELPAASRKPVDSKVARERCIAFRSWFNPSFPAGPGVYSSISSHVDILSAGVARLWTGRLRVPRAAGSLKTAERQDQGYPGDYGDEVSENRCAPTNIPTDKSFTFPVVASLQPGFACQ